MTKIQFTPRAEPEFSREGETPATVEANHEAEQNHRPDIYAQDHMKRSHAHIFRLSILSAIMVIIGTGAAGYGIYYYTKSRSIDLYSLTFADYAPFVLAAMVFLLLLGWRETLLRRRTHALMLRQIGIISQNLDRLTRRIGLEPVTESGRGEVGMTTLLTDIRRLQEQLGKSQAVRGYPKKGDDLPEPLGLDRAPPKTLSMQLGRGESKESAATSARASDSLAVSPQDRATIDSVDYGDELYPTKGGLSVEPVFSKSPPELSAAQVLHNALAADQVELYLQPVLNLPQRRLGYYRCTAVVNLPSGERLEPEFYRPIAAASGMMAMIDNALLVRLIQLARRLSRQKQAPSLICPLSGDTLRERDFFNDFRGFMRKNTELAPLLIFSIPQFVVDRLEPKVEDELVVLSKLGYRFLMSEMQRFDFFVSDLSHKGFRFVETEAKTLVDHPLFVDDPRGLKKLLDPGAIDLIVDGLDDEDVILDMLDFNLDYGRGKVFG
ncbi:MAG: EAL domain-containing protein, partial [Alphaproteobacteria bacterium]|nr:EAL domain-containing protein [Alphaproteobacteria bacterium]